MALPAITAQIYRFPPNGPYDTGLSVKTAVTINASGTSSVVTQDAAHATTDFTTAKANGILNPNAKANSATRLYVKNSEVSLDGLGYTYIGFVSATNVGADPETFTLTDIFLSSLFKSLLTLTLFSSSTLALARSCNL